MKLLLDNARSIGMILGSLNWDSYITGLGMLLIGFAAASLILRNV